MTRSAKLIYHPLDVGIGEFCGIRGEARIRAGKKSLEIVDNALPALTNYHEVFHVSGRKYEGNRTTATGNRYGLTLRIVKQFPEMILGLHGSNGTHHELLELANTGIITNIDFNVHFFDWIFLTKEHSPLTGRSEAIPPSQDCDQCILTGAAVPSSQPLLATY